jgi:hypothetical protein
MLESQIAIADRRKSDIETQLTLHASDAAKVQFLFTEQQQLLRQLEADMERWAVLAERADV